MNITNRHTSSSPVIYTQTAARTYLEEAEEDSNGAVIPNQHSKRVSVASLTHPHLTHIPHFVCLCEGKPISIPPGLRRLIPRYGGGCVFTRCAFTILDSRTHRFLNLSRWGGLPLSVGVNPYYPPGGLVDPTFPVLVRVAIHKDRTD